MRARLRDEFGEIGLEDEAEAGSFSDSRGASSASGAGPMNRAELPIELQALERELKKRNVKIDVKVIKTVDGLGADDVYITVSGKGRRHVTPSRLATWRFKPALSMRPREPTRSRHYTDIRSVSHRDPVVRRRVTVPPEIDLTGAGGC
jgi:hypothetical protein